ncbi:MAG: YitT family protein [Rikenellaceae bacterium]|nr:YitT family protein [Rikenellaceae bacterium]
MSIENILPPRAVPFSRKWLVQWGQIILGSFILALAFVLFINPYDIVPGGVYGLGIILHSIFPDIQVGTFGLAFDIPLLITGLIIFGSRFGAKTIVSAVVTPVFMNLLTSLFGEEPATMLGGHINLSGDMVLAALFGGICGGAGLGLIFKANATSGGTDIISMIVHKYLHIPIARSIMFVESVIVIVGLIVFGDWKLPLYSIITIFLMTKTIDYIIGGASNDKLLFIISEKHEEIRKYVIDNLERGGTYIKASGMYTHADKNMIFVVISRRELALVQSYIKEVDPLVFMVVVNAHETLGDGFKSLTEEKMVK